MRKELPQVSEEFSNVNLAPNCSTHSDPGTTTTLYPLFGYRTTIDETSFANAVNIIDKGCSCNLVRENQFPRTVPADPDAGLWT